GSRRIGRAPALARAGEAELEGRDGRARSVAPGALRPGPADLRRREAAQRRSCALARGQGRARRRAALRIRRRSRRERRQAGVRGRAVSQRSTERDGRVTARRRAGFPRWRREPRSRRSAMQLDKQFVLEELRKAGKDEHVQKAIQELPDKIDHEQHAAELKKFGLDPGQLAAKAAERGLASL